MKNQELAKIFYGIANYLKMDEVSFRPFIYQRVAVYLEAMEEDVEEVYKKGGKKALEDIPGVGKSIAENIEEYLKTGKIKYYEKFKKRLPLNLEELLRVEGMGPRKIKVLYHKLGVKNVKDLEKAARSHKIARLPGFGEKTEKNILEGVAFLKRSKGRFLLGDILPKAREVCSKLKTLKQIERIDYSGSLRRMKETIGDVDFLVISKEPGKVMDFFVKLPGVVKVWSKGTTKSSVSTIRGFNMDVRVLPRKSYGAALQYFTGSKEHNIATRRIAMEKGLKLSEYGLFKGKRMIAGESEEDVYKALGMQWIPPEMRENQGEVELALRHKIPEIISQKDIKGDLHCHSDWNGGEDSIEDMAKAAQKMGYQYLGIADHTKFLRIEHGLDEKKLARQRKEIEKLNERFKKSGFRILQGAETNILKDGSIDIKDEALEKLDYVIAGIHSGFKMDREATTERMIKAMRNPNVDIISHPTGRILKKREEYQIDFDRILKAAREFNVVLEINSYPERLDLNDQNIKRAREAGVKMVISTDSHQKDQMRFIEFGIAQARRGWAGKEDIINSRPLKELLTYFH